MQWREINDSTLRWGPNKTGHFPWEVARRGAWGAVQSIWACLIVNPPSAESGTLPSVIRTERLYPLSEFLLPGLVRL